MGGTDLSAIRRLSARRFRIRELGLVGVLGVALGDSMFREHTAVELYGCSMFQWKSLARGRTELRSIQVSDCGFRVDCRGYELGNSTVAGQRAHTHTEVDNRNPDKVETNEEEIGTALQKKS